MSLATVQTLDSVPQPAAEAPTYLDFIPDDPAELRRAVTHMAACINLADWRFIKLIAAMERTRGWEEGGYCNLGNWLDHRCGLGPCAARERIRIGRALARLPRINAAFRDGVISYSKVRAITRVATPETDAMLLAIAEGSSAARLESLVRTYERVGGSGSERASSEARRGLSWYYEDGMLIVTAAVPAERGALVIQALQKVVDGRKDEREAYYESLLATTCHRGTDEPAADEDVDHFGCTQVTREASDGPPVQATEDVSAETPADRTDNGKGISTETESTAVTAMTAADAAADLSAETDGLPVGLAFELESTEQRFADALVDVAEHYLASSSRDGKRRRTGQRYEVVLTIARSELAAQQVGGARCYVEPDWGIDAEDARHIACDADLTEFIADAKGNFLNYERRRRIVPARLLQALKLRDHNRCRFPGCAHRRYVEAHHVRHWIDGGETRLDNLVLLCSAHHRLLHHGAFTIMIEDDDVVFVSADGEVIESVLRPQFADVSAQVPLPGPDTVDRTLATRQRKCALYETHSERQIVDMLHFREDWGSAKARAGRLRKETLKLASENLRTI